VKLAHPGWGDVSMQQWRIREMGDLHGKVAAGIC